VIKSVTKSIRRFAASEAGPTAIEYAVMLALIIVVCISSIQMMGCQTAQAYQRLADVIQN
jgi:pilus assembly protein Flp/PilA